MSKEAHIKSKYHVTSFDKQHSIYHINPKTQLTSPSQSMIDPGFKIKDQVLYLLKNNSMSLIHFLLCTIYLYPSKGI